MALSFTYHIQAEVKGTSRDGEVSFLVEESYQSTVGASHYDYATGKVISMDLNGDLLADGVYLHLKSKIDEYVTRYSLYPDSVSIQYYRIWTSNDTPVVVYFNPTSPTTQTTNHDALMYAYLIEEATTLNPPSNIETTSFKNSISVRWTDDQYVLGYRFYDSNNNLIATVGSSPHEYIITGLEEATLYEFYIESYNGVTTSAKTSITARTEGTVDDDTTRTEEPTTVIDEYVPYTESEMGLLQAFQSGIGDGLDLQVKTDKEHTTREIVTYSMQIKGIEKQDVNIYPKREFRYRYIASDATTGAIIETTLWYDGTIDGKEPLNKDGAGKNDLTVPIQMELDTTDVKYTVELDDPSGKITMTFEKGVAPTTSYQDDKVTFSSMTDATIVKSVTFNHYGPKVKGKGMYTVEKDEILLIFEEIPAPIHDPVLSTATVHEWKTIVQSENPNVKIYIYEEPLNYLQNTKFLKLKLKAQIINPTQTPWTPMIHSGYYYMNQSERYLYSESHVRGWYEKAKEFIPLRFTYKIDLFTTRTVPGEVQTWEDMYRSHFKGSFTNTTMDRFEGDIALLDDNFIGTYISESKVFNNNAIKYDPVTWNATETYGGKVRVYTQAKAGDGSWTAWEQIINGQVIPSPLSQEIRYKLELIPGDKKNNTITEYIDELNAEFMTGVNVNAGNINLQDNIKVENDIVLMNDTEIKTGLYTSATFDIGTEIDSLGTLSYRHTLSEGTGAVLEIYTASQDVDSDWELATWQPLSLAATPTVNPDGSITGTIQSAPKQFFRYQVRFTRSRKEVTTIRELATDDDFNLGRHYNTHSFESALQLKDQTQAGEYVSPALEFPHNEAWLEPYFDYTLPFQDGSVTIYTISSNDRDELSNITVNDPNWLPLSSTGLIQSTVQKYLVFKVKFEPGLDSGGGSETPKLHGAKIYSDSFVYLSPTFDTAHIEANTYYMTKVTPILHDIKLSGEYDDIITKELYTKPIASEVLSNQDLYRITDKTIEKIMDEYLTENLVDRNYLVFDKYKISTKTPGVILTSRAFDDYSQIMSEDEIEKGCVYAQTTDIVQEYIYEQIRVKVNTDNTALVSPIPQQGAPIIAKDLKGEMNYVTFYDESGNVTLTNTEEIISDGRHEFILSYPDADPDTLNVYFWIPEEDKWELVPNAKLTINLVTLPYAFEAGVALKATYKRKRSFCVDYNFNIEDDYVKVYFHQAVLDSLHEVKMYFETNTESAFYSAREINLNPLKNHQHAGFVYITDKTEPAQSIELYAYPEVMYANGHDTTYLSAIVKDRYGNPVVGETIEFRSTKGVVISQDAITDVNGIVNAKFVAPPQTDTAVITAVNKTTPMEDNKEIYIKPERLPARLSLEINKQRLTPDGIDTVQITAYVVNSSQEYINNETVEFTVTSGTLSSSTEKTSYFGKAKTKLSTTTVPANEIIQVKVSVPTYNLYEVVNVRVNGA